jgi:hypothetical protein
MKYMSFVLLSLIFMSNISAMDESADQNRRYIGNFFAQLALEVSNEKMRDLQMVNEAEIINVQREKNTDYTTYYAMLADGSSIQAYKFNSGADAGFKNVCRCVKIQDFLRFIFPRYARVMLDPACYNTIKRLYKTGSHAGELYL